MHLGNSYIYLIIKIFFTFALFAMIIISCEQENLDIEYTARTITVFAAITVASTIAVVATTI